MGVRLRLRRTACELANGGLGLCKERFKGGVSKARKRVKEYGTVQASINAHDALDVVAARHIQATWRQSTGWSEQGHERELSCESSEL